MRHQLLTSTILAVSALALLVGCSHGDGMAPGSSKLCPRAGCESWDAVDGIWLGVDCADGLEVMPVACLPDGSSWKLCLDPPVVPCSELTVSGGRWIDQLGLDRGNELDALDFPNGTTLQRQ